MNRPIRYLLAALLLAAAGIFFWSTIHYRSDTPQAAVWVDDEGRTHVLGITLLKTTLRDAEAVLKSRSETALYQYPPEHEHTGMRLEAYFPSIADHSKVILLLQTEQSQLDGIVERAARPRRYPSGVTRFNLAGEDQQWVQHLPVQALTLIPSIEITEEMLTKRFGQPSSRRTREDGSTLFIFRDIGLEARLTPEDAATLYFANPTNRAEQ